MIVPAPGHTLDSVVIFVSLPSGKRYVFVGDAVWQTEGLAIPAEKPWMLRRLIGEDRQEVDRTIALIRTIVARYPQMRAVPAHDVRAYRSIAIFPGSTR